jgi:hypothetical protein
MRRARHRSTLRRSGVSPIAVSPSHKTDRRDQRRIASRPRDRRIPLRRNATNGARVDASRRKRDTRFIEFMTSNGDTHRVVRPV